MAPADLPKVLIVDDERANRHVLAMMLRRIGHDCVDTCDGQEAVDVIKTGAQFGVVVMDLQMPVMDGFEATRQIRELTCSEGRYLPIVALTAAATDAIRQAGFDAGIDDFMTKPVEIRTLRAKLNMWIESEPNWSTPDVVPSSTVRMAVTSDFAALDRVPSFDPEVLRRLHILGRELEPPAVITTAEQVLKELLSNAEAIPQALVRSDFRQLHGSAHRLAGAARKIGANHLADLCADLRTELERLTKPSSGPSVRPAQCQDDAEGTTEGRIYGGTHAETWQSLASESIELTGRVTALVRLVTSESRHVQSVVREFLGGVAWA